ncbi:MAG: hypothetical protein IJZ48_07060 [Oscillospiraceae bacterium]|nr:hypothetical protein [Oscillospiraceae bacterium]
MDTSLASAPFARSSNAFNLALTRLSWLSLRACSISLICSSLNLYLEAIFITQIQYIISLQEIWWYIAPTIINTFLESHDLTGKTVITFATSGGSGMGDANAKLQQSCKGAKLIEGQVFNPDVCKADLSAWVDSLKIE